MIDDLSINPLLIESQDTVFEPIDGASAGIFCSTYKFERFVSTYTILFPFSSLIFICMPNVSFSELQ